jgi:Cof subfamily protein (haloacid dehalogenase superfamily)
MICLDIDGTLLTSDHKISEKTKEVINVVSKEKQIPVVLVSARMPKGIFSLQDELNIQQPIICYSGALVLNKDNTLTNITIPIAEVRQVYNCAKATGAHISLYKDDEWFIEKMDPWAKQESEITNIQPSIVRFTELLNGWDKENLGPNKILCMSEPVNIKVLETRLHTSSYNKLNIYTSKPTYLEIMPNNVSKTSAIELLCRKYAIEMSEVVAIGDNYNDINMIEYAGLGIAMGNAPDKVKQCADYVTLSNDEDGVAEAIKLHVLS